MAIYAVGAFYDEDISGKFIENDVAGIGWSESDAPELHQFIKSLKISDIIYIKSFSPSSPDIIVKGIGIVTNGESVECNFLEVGRNIKWIVTELFRIPKPKEKNNVRANTMYEEFHPDVQDAIINKIFQKIK